MSATLLEAFVPYLTKLSQERYDKGAGTTGLSFMSEGTGSQRREVTCSQ